MIQATHVAGRGGAPAGTPRILATAPLPRNLVSRCGTLGISTCQQGLLGQAKTPRKLKPAAQVLRQLTTPHAAAPEAAPSVTAVSSSESFDINVSAHFGQVGCVGKSVREVSEKVLKVALLQQEAFPGTAF